MNANFTNSHGESLITCKICKIIVCTLQNNIYVNHDALDLSKFTKFGSFMRNICKSLQVFITYRFYNFMYQSLREFPQQLDGFFTQNFTRFTIS